MRVWVIASVGLVLSQAAFGAVPKGKEAQYAALLRQGEQLYLEGKYLASAAALKQAHELDPHPRLVYNIARAYDQAGNVDDAIKYYALYLNSPDGTDAVLTKRAALALDRLRALSVREKAGESEKAKLADQASQAEERARVEAERARRAKREAEQSREIVQDVLGDVEGRSKMGTYVAGGLGVALLASTVTFGLLASSTKGEFVRTGPVAEKRRLELLTRQQALISDVSLGMALAALATAYFIYPRAEEEYALRLGISPAGAHAQVSF